MINNTSNIKNFVPILWVTIGLLMVLILSINSFFTFPSSDDFVYYIDSHAMGFWKFQKWHYLNWGGRYVPNAVLGSFNFESLGLILYKVLPLGMIWGLFLSMFFFIKKILKLNNRLTIFLSCVMFLCYGLSLLSTAQQFYWLPGSITYNLGICLCLITWGSLENLNQRNFILIFILVFLLNGTNEICMLMFNISLVFLMVYRLITKAKTSRLLYILTFFSFVFCLISIGAPGNSVRSELADVAGENVKNLSFALPRSFYRGILFILDFFYNYFILFLFLVAHITYFPKKFKLPFKKNIYLKLAIILFPFVILFAGVFPSYFASGRIPPERTSNVIGFFFMMSIILSLLTYHSNFDISKKILEQRKLISYIASLLLGISFLFSSNDLKLNIIDLCSGKAYAHHSKMKDRIQLIKTSKKEEIGIKKIDIPKSIIFRDRINFKYIKYYKKRNIFFIENDATDDTQ